MSGENLDFMIFGYTAGFVIIGILVSSIWLRYRGLQQQQDAIEALEQDIQKEKA